MERYVSAAAGAAGTWSTPGRGVSSGANEIGAVTAVPEMLLPSATPIAHVPSASVQLTTPFVVTSVVFTANVNE